MPEVWNFVPHERERGWRVNKDTFIEILKSYKEKEGIFAKIHLQKKIKLACNGQQFPITIINFYWYLTIVLVSFSVSSDGNITTIPFCQCSCYYWTNTSNTAHFTVQLIFYCPNWTLMVFKNNLRHDTSNCSPSHRVLKCWNNKRRVGIPEKICVLNYKLNGLWNGKLMKYLIIKLSNSSALKESPENCHQMDEVLKLE